MLLQMLNDAYFMKVDCGKNLQRRESVKTTRTQTNTASMALDKLNSMDFHMSPGLSLGCQGFKPLHVQANWHRS